MSTPESCFFLPPTAVIFEIMIADGVCLHIIMPSGWKAIDNNMEETCPKGRESKEAFLNRLKKCARTLPRSLVRKAIGKMRENIQGVIDARGSGVPGAGFA